MCRRRSSISTTIQANKAKKIDISKQGLNSIKNKVVKNNLMGVSESMSKKDWKDSQGRKGKVPSPLPPRPPGGGSFALCFAQRLTSALFITITACRGLGNTKRAAVLGQGCLASSGSPPCIRHPSTLLPTYCAFSVSSICRHTSSLSLSQGFGVYRFANKYGANVDGYSPIYTPDVWSETGNEYKLGTKGLLAWCDLLLSVALCRH